MESNVDHSPEHRVQHNYGVVLEPSTRRHKYSLMRTMPRSRTKEKKLTAHLAHLHEPQSTTNEDALRNFRTTVQLKLCIIKDLWLSARAENIQSYADRSDMKNFYSSLKEVNDPTSAGLSQGRTRSWRSGLKPPPISDKATEWPVNESLNAVPILRNFR